MNYETFVKINKTLNETVEKNWNEFRNALSNSDYSTVEKLFFEKYENRKDMLSFIEMCFTKAILAKDKKMVSLLLSFGLKANKGTIGNNNGQAYNIKILNKHFVGCQERGHFDFDFFDFLIESGFKFGNTAHGKEQKLQYQNMKIS